MLKYVRRMLSPCKTSMSLPNYKANNGTEGFVFVTHNLGVATLGDIASAVSNDVIFSE